MEEKADAHAGLLPRAVPRHRRSSPVNEWRLERPTARDVRPGVEHKYQPVLHVQDDVRLVEYVPIIPRTRTSTTHDVPNNADEDGGGGDDAESSSAESSSMTLRLDLQPQHLMAFQLGKVMEQSMHTYRQLGASDTDLDELKWFMSMGLFKWVVVQVGRCACLASKRASQRLVDFVRVGDGQSLRAVRNYRSQHRTHLVCFCGTHAR